MSTMAASLLALCAAIILALGLLHLLFTFHGPKLLPRDRELQARMQEAVPVITRRTTMWKAWIGFNATHSLGLILFGAVYGYLSLVHADFLFRSTFLLSLGLLLLLGYAFLAKRYFFHIPFRGVLLATILYIASMLIAANTPAAPQDPRRNGLPSWLLSKMERYDAMPQDQAPLGIWQLTRQGQPAYFEISPCCDQYNPLFNSKGQKVCSPNGGIHGGGDMQCPRPADPHTAVRLVWVHPKASDQNPGAPQLGQD